GATAADGEPLSRGPAGGAAEWAGPVAVIVGNEGAGIRPALNAVAAKRVAIPLAAGAESLNVAVAAGILLYEVLRGRWLAAGLRRGVGGALLRELPRCVDPGVVARRVAA